MTRRPLLLLAALLVTALFAQANAQVDDKGHLVNDKVIARSGGEFLVIDRDQVDFIDVSPRQVV